MVTLYHISVDLTLHEPQLDENWTRYYRDLLRLPLSEARTRRQPTVLTGPVLERGTGMPDFAPGPGSTFIVSDSMRAELEESYGDTSIFDPLRLRGCQEMYFVWTTLTVVQLVDPDWQRPVGHTFQRMPAEWVEENVRSIDIARDTVFRGSWFCVDNPERPKSFYQLAASGRFSGVRLDRCWPDAD